MEEPHSNSYDNKDNLISKRAFFKSSEIRNEFFGKLKKKFGTWTSIQTNHNIHKSKLELFRSGDRSLPYELFLELIKYLRKDEKQFFLNNLILKNRNWGCIKGGKNTYKKHPEIFSTGRALSIKLRKPKYAFDFHMPLSPELCEFIGAFIGDGFTNKYSNNYVTQITGDKILDKNYYINVLAPIVKKLSKNSNPIVFQTNDALRLNINSKEFHELLTKRFNLKAGKKVYSVVIPEEIMNSRNLKLTNSCLRGIFDTDGCVGFDKRNSYLIPYIRIILKMESKEIIKQIYQLLEKQEIKPTITKNSKVIQINGFENCKRFVDLIGFSNPRHLIKIKAHYGFSTQSNDALTD